MHAEYQLRVSARKLRDARSRRPRPDDLRSDRPAAGECRMQGRTERLGHSGPSVVPSTRNPSDPNLGDHLGVRTDADTSMMAQQAVENSLMELCIPQSRRASYALRLPATNTVRDLACAERD